MVCEITSSEIQRKDRGKGNRKEITELKNKRREDVNVISSIRSKEIQQRIQTESSDAWARSRTWLSRAARILKRTSVYCTLQRNKHNGVPFCHHHYPCLQEPSYSLRAASQSCVDPELPLLRCPCWRH
ncbi:Hypothetical predicted protein [Podarcis lilfordi]|uniref:Uncharacterized protein n=1 Tax=Podarcis lilfordi TaxID=74358 RepID=A0AA35L654_9SAUR|nr:Hypothetical predicted protein [Podarcis lilfordi]